MSVFRVFVEKKNEFAVEARKLKLNLSSVLEIKSIEQVRVFNKYDIKGISKQVFELALNGILSEPQVDDFYFNLPKLDGFGMAVEFLPGQFDIRANFCKQCVQLLDFNAKIEVKTAKVYFFKGVFSNYEIEKIKSFLVNPIESRLVSVDEPVNFLQLSELNDEIEVLNDFNNLNDSSLKEFLFDYSLAMDFYDLKFCQNYFKKIEKRPPTLAEIKVIDTYWSDHCRHTTFLTTIDEIKIVDLQVKLIFENYLDVRKELGCFKEPLNLMDLATIASRKLKFNGKLNDVDESDEINACSVSVEVETVNSIENWFLVFKNETHNHPTEIEPFGGAATCIGGAIRDPLSARAYVFQAMRISGAANPLKPFSETLKGKLPQHKIVTTAAEGYSSYGNQVGVATGFVQEIYHSGYVAKRLEIGAVMGAVLKQNVVKKMPMPGDVVLLLGGRTGRDGCGGATGSSKIHDEFSINDCGAQVQKGNPVEERKLQRFFKNASVSRLIKRCNDFGAGGVCVAIGELADGVEVCLDAIPKKYYGLSAIELAISESQERMAVVVARENVDFLLHQAELENLMATEVAKVVDNKRLKLLYKGTEVVNLSRAFLNSNGMEKKAVVETGLQNFSLKFNFSNNEQGWFDFFSNLNLCSQKGLVEMFDSTIGSGCVLMPYGGKFQATKSQVMAFKFPTDSICKTVALMAFGFNPFLMEKSSFYGAQFSVVESIAKLIAVGGSLKRCWLTFQEYFPSLKNDAKLWGEPFLALLGAFNAQINFEVAAIGGKDSMSGTFEKFNVPPTLVSFAVSTVNLKRVISPEFKQVGSTVVSFLPIYGKNDICEYNSVKSIFLDVESFIERGWVHSVYAIGLGGIPQAICEMCVGNGIGFKFVDDFDENKFNFAYYGGFILELKKEFENEILHKFKGLEIVGETIESFFIVQKKFQVSLAEIENVRANKLKSVFSIEPVNFKPSSVHNVNCSSSSERQFAKINLFKVKVLIPVFPGTNCEFDLAKKFEQAGACCEQFVINNLNGKKLLKSVKDFVEKLKTSQIVAIAGGFSASDEPEGAAKFIAAFFRNDLVSFELNRFLNFNDGLMLGICNGFQALVKLGLIEHEKVTLPTENLTTLTYNKIGRYQSKLVRTRICCNKSPWLANTCVGEVFTLPISNGEGCFVAPDEVLVELERNGQIATQYVDFDGNASMDIEHNPSSSSMAIEGLTSKSGRIFGKMGHSERVELGLFKNVGNFNEQEIFKAGVAYFKK